MDVSWTVKKAECRRIDAFELWYWRRLLRVPWTARRSNQSILKEISPGCSLEGMMLKLKLQYFGHLMWRVDSLEDSDAGRDWGQEENGTTEDEMAGWHHRLNVCKSVHFMTILSHDAENVHSQVWHRFCWQATQRAVNGLGHKTVSRILWTTSYWALGEGKYSILLLLPMYRVTLFPSSISYGTIYYSIRALMHTFDGVRNNNFVKQVKYK